MDCVRLYSGRFSTLGGLYMIYLSLAGRYGLPTARRLFPLLREFIAASESIGFDIIIGL